jgi:hypothetical protein
MRRISAEGSGTGGPSAVNVQCPKPTAVSVPADSSPALTNMLWIKIRDWNEKSPLDV